MVLSGLLRPRPNALWETILGATASLLLLTPDRRFVHAFATDVCDSTRRLGNTNADAYYQEHGHIPRPQTMHRILSEQDLVDNNADAGPDGSSEAKGFLVVGDVHGCLDELKLLHAKAVEENDDTPFRQVLLLGDLVNKGPESARVVKYAKEQRWLSVRGNHDDGALATALGDPVRKKKKKYQWVLETTDVDRSLSDADVDWMAELPYTIRIPGSWLNNDHDTMLVHAGFVPDLPSLDDQTIDTMVTIRFVREEANDQGDGRCFLHHKPNTAENAVLWGKAWTGPEHVMFGHDARRGLQRHPFATGLDTGAVYGNELTGMILPSRKIVQVKSLKTYSGRD